MADQIEIIAIGNELLKGITVNSNAAEIAFALFKEGYRCHQHLVLPDDKETIKNQFQKSLKRSKIVITTGGLGPTCDDITRAVAAEVFQSDFIFNEALAEELKQRYPNLPISLNDQATIPNKAILLKNPLGTAPGFVFHSEIGTLILMPGVPKEMRAMLIDLVIPYIKTHFPLIERPLRCSLHFFGIGESSVDPLLRKLETQYPEVEFGIYPSHGLISVHASINAPSQESEKHLNEIQTTLKEQFFTNFYSETSEKIEVAIQQLFIENQWTLGTAESCTGGAVAARLTRNPGASDYFLGGLVTYSNQLKEKFLHLDKQMISLEGAVNETTVRAMALGALNAIGSDFAVAISGIAGPTGGSKDKPVGTVWIAVARRRQETYSRKIQAYGNRKMIIEQSVNAALGTLYHYASQRLI